MYKRMFDIFLVLIHFQYSILCRCHKIAGRVTTLGSKSTDGRSCDPSQKQKPKYIGLAGVLCTQSYTSSFLILTWFLCRDRCGNNHLRYPTGEELHFIRPISKSEMYGSELSGPVPYFYLFFCKLWFCLRTIILEGIRKTLPVIFQLAILAMTDNLFIFCTELELLHGCERRVTVKTGLLIL